MASFNDLIKKDPELAAGILLNAGIHVVNTHIPGIYLNKDEYKQLVNIIIEGKAKDPVDMDNDADDEDSEDPSTPGGSGGSDTPPTTTTTPAGTYNVVN